MSKRKAAALLMIITIGWTTFSVGQLSLSSASPIGIQFAQEEEAACRNWAGGPGGRSFGGPFEASARGPLCELADAARTVKSVPDSCSFVAPDGHRVGTYTTLPDGFVCRSLRNDRHPERLDRNQEVSADAAQIAAGH